MKKLIIVSIISLFTVSCGVNAPFSVISPWGDVTQDAEGNVVVAPKPIVIDKKSSK